MIQDVVDLIEYQHQGLVRFVSTDAANDLEKVDRGGVVKTFEPRPQIPLPSGSVF